MENIVLSEVIALVERDLRLNCYMCGCIISTARRLGESMGICEICEEEKEAWLKKED